MNKINAIDERQYVNEVIALNKKRHEFVDELNKKYAKMMIRDIEHIIRTEVDAFYGDYEPNSYDRYGSLYDIYDINIDAERHRMSIDVDYQYMKEVISDRQRRLSNAMIFHNAMELGWHGGAIPKDQNARTVYGNKVMPDTPYWRTPDHKNWWKPAEIMDGEAPIYRIEQRVRKYIREKNKEFNAELENYNNSFHNKVIRLTKGLYKGRNGGRS